MVTLVRKYQFTNNLSENLVGCVFDWFEVRVKSRPLHFELYKYGYIESMDKGCATHNHYFETDDFSIAWDIKSSYIDKIWSHFRVKNHVLYGIRGFNSVVDYVLSSCRRIFDCGLDDVIIVRLDYAYDMPVGSLEHNIIRSRFENRMFNVDKYTEFHGKVGYFNYTNYSAGNRASRVFLRLYYKTVENTDYQTRQPKKEYIFDWHQMLFGNVDVVRFEVEFKPQGNMVLSDLVYGRFTDFWAKYVNCDSVNLCLGEYNSDARTFSRVKAKKLHSLLSEFVLKYADSAVFVTDVINGCLKIMEDK